ncbi:hypothetical protein GPA10_40415 [Streptomyces sp. p1417]|uniref:Chaplin n=1 Tax=Streptomyces typhae TaxID=2681492 RepID=A0A6L6XAB7_9ACTN|nr:hypothetical protein [Streptomyces typhae]MVO90842.1 hypothetical protein [Streptomyces typhae]
MRMRTAFAAVVLTAAASVAAVGTAAADDAPERVTNVHVVPGHDVNAQSNLYAVGNSAPSFGEMDLD